LGSWGRNAHSHDAAPDRAGRPSAAVTALLPVCLSAICRAIDEEVRHRLPRRVRMPGP
jgi:hypothetical protein